MISTEVFESRLPVGSSARMTCGRFAIARALLNRPSLLLADEPTGNLDSQTGREILDLFQELHARGNSIIMVTHEDDVAREAKRVIHIRDGKVSV